MNVLEKYNRYNTFYCGPWIGEFGWELFGWQGYLRTLRNLNNVKIHIVCQPSHAYLYQDFVDSIQYFSPQSGEPDTYRRKGFELPENTLEHYFNDHKNPYSLVLYPPTSRVVEFVKDITPMYVPYGIEGQKKYDVLLHARSTQKLETAYRNWPIHKWEQLLDWLLMKNLKIAAIGRTKDAFVFDNIDNLHDLPLHVLCDTIRNSKLVMGPSSGPMHLASLCKTPHVVWTAKNTVALINNRKRYEEVWNPFKTLVSVIDHEGWQPSVETVYNSVMKMLENE